MADTIKVEITSADIPGLLRALAEKNITLHDLKQTDDLTFTCKLDRNGYSVLFGLLAHRGDTIKLVSRKGVGYFLVGLLQRPILTAGLLILMMLSVWLPTRVLFVEVTGNTNIPTRLILEEASACGIRFGTSRRKVRSEQIKNRLLSAVPELQWAGINTYGCVARISVKEKSKLDDTAQQNMGVSSIVAARDGIITDCIVQKGNLLCSVGQAVKAGQTLVSGYVDCGLMIQMTGSEAEISADTMRNLQAALPATCTTRGDMTGQSVKFGLLLGKKLINFCKDSGISDAMCVKMYSKKYLTLPGGRTLPIALMIEKCIFYENATAQIDPAIANTLLEGAAHDYLSDQMISGQIIHADTKFFVADNSFFLHGKYACNEIIGQVRHEERIYTNGKNF